MRSLYRPFLVILLAFTIVGCGLSKSMEASSKAAEQFHLQLNDSKFAEIYADTSAGFQSVSKEADFVALLSAIRRKMGPFKTSNQTGWNINTNNGVTTVVVTFKSEYEQGSAVETFTFLSANDTLKLHGYNINSPTLITK